MIFTETELNGAYIIDIDPMSDERGFFARTFCRHEFEDRGLHADYVQCSVSFNKLKGTLRGMHYQAAPYEEIKLIRATMGSIYDVIVDIRPGSSTFGHWVAVELSAENRRMLYVPKGFAHGFQTLEDNVEVFYQMSEYHHPEAARGVRWDDPDMHLTWPLSPIAMSDRDRALSCLRALRAASANR